MTDIHSPEIRSKNMRAIRSSDTKPELLVRKSLYAAGLRYRLGGYGLPGRPDLVSPKHKTAIFVHGCFWHGHDCKYFKIPKTRTDFWLQKISSNKDRDLRNTTQLIEQGWSVIIVWECTTRNAAKDISRIAAKVRIELYRKNDIPRVTEI